MEDDNRSMFHFFVMNIMFQALVYIRIMAHNGSIRSPFLENVASSSVYT